MKLKLDENGNAVLQDGNPVYTHADGKELPFKAAETIATITRLNGEAKSHRERAESAEASLKSFDGISDPSAAIQALKTVQNLDDKKLVDAGEIERVKSETIKAFENKYAPVIAERDKLQRDLYSEKVGGAFARSKFIGEECDIPADLMRAQFGQNFKVDEGKTVGYDQNGNQISSRINPGEPADFEEALEILVDGYAHKDSILKRSQASGGGQQSTTNQAGQKTISRSTFESHSPAEQSAFMKEGGSVTD